MYLVCTVRSTYIAHKTITVDGYEPIRVTILFLLHERHLFFFHSSLGPSLSVSHCFYPIWSMVLRHVLAIFRFAFPCCFLFLYFLFSIYFFLVNLPSFVEKLRVGIYVYILLAIRVCA
jgi:hypothetical protein